MYIIYQDDNAVVEEKDVEEQEEKEPQPLQKKQRKNEWGVMIQDVANNENKLPKRPTNESILDAYMGSDPFVPSECADPTNTSKMLQQLRNFVFGTRGSIDNTLLLRVALRYFSTPASSAPTERVWSSATNTFTKNRRSFTGDNFASALFVSCNQHRVIIDQLIIDIVHITHGNWY